ncbi:MAG: hypothetical protein R3C18_23500 [Planctomycetaceae bacterium]
MRVVIYSESLAGWKSGRTDRGPLERLPAISQAATRSARHSLVDSLRQRLA